jgi:hypothetical protein
MLIDKYIHHITILKFETANDLSQFNNKQLISMVSGYMQYGFKLVNQTECTSH